VYVLFSACMLRCCNMIYFYFNTSSNDPSFGRSESATTAPPFSRLRRSELEADVDLARPASVKVFDGCKTYCILSILYLMMLLSSKYNTGSLRKLSSCYNMCKIVFGLSAMMSQGMILFEIGLTYWVARWLSGRASDLRYRSRGFEAWPRR